MYILTILSMHLQPYMNHTINYPEMSILSNRPEIHRIFLKLYWNNFFTFCFFSHPALAISDLCSKIWTVKHANSIFYKKINNNHSKVQKIGNFLSRFLSIALATVLEEIVIFRSFFFLWCIQVTSIDQKKTITRKKVNGLAKKIFFFNCYTFVTQFSGFDSSISEWILSRKMIFWVRFFSRTRSGGWGWWHHPMGNY